MPTSQPLDVEEELLWRSLMRLVITLPRTLSDALERTADLNATEYQVLMYLSEAPRRQLRMSDLAERTALSAGRITRVVDDMVKRGLVSKQRCPEDGRSMLATLTKQGFSTLKRAYPHLLQSSRDNVFDHLAADETAYVGVVLRRLVEAVDAANTSGRARASSNRRRT
jgi:DNA-binding MarR family transcriptional regulator